tara:strand:+ start:1798 stop:3231 length:1434 start_codon:yes stop_codon:yes gene_type:complete
MADTTYGTGTALQFTDGSQRQVLELGDKIHMYNPEMTPIFTLFSKLSKNVTPVPIFEWMEDEYMIKRSIVLSAGEMTADVDVVDSQSGGTDGHQCIINLPRQAQVELFEVGGVYTITGATQGENNTHFVCIAIGQNVNLASPTDKSVQFIGGTYSGTTWTYNQVANSVDVIEDGADTTITFIGRINSVTATASAGLLPGGYGVDGASISNGATASVASLDGYAEGAGIGVETSKKVRRLKNCTQIFREPYTITGTADASKHYGGPEMARLQARKLAKIKTDIEYALLTNGNISLDATSENPTRTFAGLGVGVAGGVLQTYDGFDNADMQISFSSGTMDQMDVLCEKMFHDLVAGSMSKVVFASNKWLRFLGKITRAQATEFVDEGNSEQVAGLRVRKFVGAVGELNFVAHPLLNGGLENYAVACDPANFDVRALNGRDMQLRSDVVKDGRDGKVDEWLMEFGPEIRNEQTHAIMKLT